MTAVPMQRGARDICRKIPRRRREQLQQRTQRDRQRLRSAYPQGMKDGWTRQEKGARGQYYGRGMRFGRVYSGGWRADVSRYCHGDVWLDRERNRNAGCWPGLMPSGRRVRPRAPVPGSGLGPCLIWPVDGAMLGWLCPVWGVVWPAGDLQASGPAAVAETSNTNIWTGDGGHGAAAVTRAGTTNCGITYLYMYTATRYVELAIQPAPRKGPKELQIARSSLARLGGSQDWPRGLRGL